MEKEELEQILEKHRKWLNDEEGGERANLSEVNLSRANLREADLSGANLSEVNLSEVNLSRAILSRAILREANLSRANLSRANLREADLRGVKYNEHTAFFALCCPEEGSFIGYKKAGEKIVKLQIPSSAKRSSATSRKCRCSKAKVLSITNPDGTDSGVTKIASDRDESFLYEVGKTVRVDNFDEDRWNECSTGIHFFVTRDEAVRYN